MLVWVLPSSDAGPLGQGMRDSFLAADPSAATAVRSSWGNLRPGTLPAMPRPLAQGVGWVWWDGVERQELAA